MLPVRYNSVGKVMFRFIFNDDLAYIHFLLSCSHHVHNGVRYIPTWPAAQYATKREETIISEFLSGGGCWAGGGGGGRAQRGNGGGGAEERKEKGV